MVRSNGKRPKVGGGRERGRQVWKYLCEDAKRKVKVNWIKTVSDPEGDGVGPARVRGRGAEQESGRCRLRGRE